MIVVTTSEGLLLQVSDCSYGKRVIYHFFHGDEMMMICALY